MSFSRASKQYKEFDVLLTLDEEDKNRLWMRIETNNFYTGKHQIVSGFVNPPNFIDRLRGITWQDKIAAREKKLFKEVLGKIKAAENCELQNEIEKWYR